MSIWVNNFGSVKRVDFKLLMANWVALDFFVCLFILYFWANRIDLTAFEKKAWCLRLHQTRVKRVHLLHVKWALRVEILVLVHFTLRQFVGEAHLIRCRRLPLGTIAEYGLSLVFSFQVSCRLCIHRLQFVKLGQSVWSLLWLLNICLVDGFDHAQCTGQVVFTYLYLLLETFFVKSVCVVHVIIIQNQIERAFTLWSFLTSLSVVCAETRGEHLLFLGRVARHNGMLWNDLLLRGLNLHLLILVLFHFFFDFFTRRLVLKSEQSHFLFLKPLIVIIYNFGDNKKVLLDSKIARLLLNSM